MENFKEVFLSQKNGFIALNYKCYFFASFVLNVMPNEDVHCDAHNNFGKSSVGRGFSLVQRRRRLFLSISPLLVTAKKHCKALEMCECGSDFPGICSTNVFISGAHCRSMPSTHQTKPASVCHQHSSLFERKFAPSRGGG